MRKIVIWGAVGAVLAGCAVYDEHEVPGAIARQKLAMEQCTANTMAGQYGGLSQAIECELDADKGLVTAIKLRQMDLFETYQARMRLTAQQFDAKALSFEQANLRLQSARSDLIGGIMQAQATNEADRIQAAAAMGAIGQSFERAADRQAYIQAHNPTVNCTSNTFGGTVNTTCH